MSFHLSGKKTSGVKCQKAELVDLSERPDVERYDWDGTNVDFEAQVQ